MSKCPLAGSGIGDHRQSRRATAAGLLLLTVTVTGLGGVPSVRAAGPVYWDWPAAQPFADVELAGAAVDPDGCLTVGLARQEGHLAGQDVVWKIVRDGRGGFYSGTGHTGELYHTDADGDSRLVCQLEGTEIFSLLVLPDGELLVGCGPEGHVYRVDPSGEATLLGMIEGGYVWAMAHTADPTDVWLACGSPAAVYRLDEQRQPVLVAELPAQNCLDLAPDGRGGMLAVTQGPGLLYRLDDRADAQPELLFEAPQDELRQFVVGPDGDLFVLALHSQEMGAGGGGKAKRPVPPGQPRTAIALFPEDNVESVNRSALYKVSIEGLVSPWWTGDKDLMIAAWSSDHGWLAGGPLANESDRAVLHRLLPPAGDHPIAGWDGGDILDLVILSGGRDHGDRVLVGQAHPGGVSVLGTDDEERPAALSPPLDAGVQVRWGRLAWQGDEGHGKPRWSVRIGNRSVPDESWTEWTSSWTDRDHELDVAPSRFLQWRVEFPRSGGQDQSWRVTEVAVSAWEENLPPVVSKFQREHVRVINRGGLIPAGKNVTQTLRSGLRLEFNKASVRDRRAEGRQASRTRPVHTFSWTGTDPNEDRLLYDLDYRRRGDEAWRSIVTGSPEQMGSWDTADLPDGSYEIRVTVSDARDNPPHLALDTSRRLGPVTVDNSPPVIEDFRIKATDGGFLVSFSATDQASNLAGARIELPNGTHQRLDPADLICDSRSEAFAANWDWPRPEVAPGPQPWLIRVEVEDLAGNLAVAEGVVR